MIIIINYKKIISKILPLFLLLKNTKLYIKKSFDNIESISLKQNLWSTNNEAFEYIYIIKKVNM